MHPTINYKEMERMLMTTIKEEKYIRQQEFYDFNKFAQNVMRHGMKTNKGDSGSPLIVQPRGMNGMCFLFGIHCSGMYKTKEKI